MCGSGKAEKVSPHGCRMTDGKWLGSDALLVDPGDRHPLWGVAGLLKGFLQQLEAFFHAVVDQREVEVVCVSAPDALRILPELLQSLCLQETGQWIRRLGREEGNFTACPSSQTPSSYHQNSSSGC